MHFISILCAKTTCQKHYNAPKNGLNTLQWSRTFEVLFNPKTNKIMSLHLTKREIQIIHKIAEGCCSKEIASLLFISIRTVETHRKNIKLKLGMNNFYSVITYAFRNGILKIDDADNTLMKVV